MLIERHASLAQALAHEVVTVEIGGDRERQIGRDPQAHRPHDRIPDVPVQVQEPLPSGLDPPVGLVATPRRPLRCVRDEGAAVLQAGQDAGDPLMGSQLPVVRPDQLLFSHPLRRWEQRDPLALGVLLDPRSIGRRPSQQHLRLDARHPHHVVEEVDQLLRSLQPRQVAVQDDPIETRVLELDTLPKDLRQSIHGTPSLARCTPASTPGIIASSGSPVDSPAGFQVHLARVRT